jgi:hypothetical protein
VTTGGVAWTEATIDSPRQRPRQRRKILIKKKHGSEQSLETVFLCISQFCPRADGSYKNERPPVELEGMPIELDEDDFVVFLAGAFFAAGFLAAAFFLAGAFFAAGFLAAAFFLAGAFFAAGFLAVLFFVVVFLAAFFGAAFFVVFLAGAFFVVFLAAFFGAAFFVAFLAGFFTVFFFAVAIGTSSSWLRFRIYCAIVMSCHVTCQDNDI